MLFLLGQMVFPAFERCPLYLSCLYLYCLVTVFVLSCSWKMSTVFVLHKILFFSSHGIPGCRFPINVPPPPPPPLLSKLAYRCTVKIILLNWIELSRTNISTFICLWINRLIHAEVSHWLHTREVWRSILTWYTSVYFFFLGGGGSVQFLGNSS